jgi:hypothetical protein
MLLAEVTNLFNLGQLEHLAQRVVGVVEDDSLKD